MPTTGLLTKNFTILKSLLLGFDLIALISAAWLAYYYKFGSTTLETPYIIATLIGSTITTVCYYYHNPYALSISNTTIGQVIKQQALAVISTILALMLTMSAIAVLAKVSDTFSRQWFVNWLSITAFLLLVIHISTICTLKILRTNHLYASKIVIIGDLPCLKSLVRTLQHNHWTAKNLVAILSINASNTKHINNIPIIPTPENLPEYLTSMGINEVWILLSATTHELAMAIMHALRDLTITKRIIFDFSACDLLNHSIDTIDEFTVLTVQASPLHGYKRIVKTMEDFILASIILTLVSPLMLVIAAAIKYSSPGPILYRQERLSWNGKTFAMLKFRTMPIDTEAATGPVWAKANEQRATKLGAFLRKTSLDELPQFINVLRGEMSIVGPRPEREVFVNIFKDQVPRYMQKHYVKAGITGWAQVNGWRGNTSIEQRIDHDLYYINNWSLYFDCKIILLTLIKGFINRNAY